MAKDVEQDWECKIAQQPAVKKITFTCTPTHEQPRLSSPLTATKPAGANCYPCSPQSGSLKGASRPLDGRDKRHARMCPGGQRLAGPGAAIWRGRRLQSGEGACSANRHEPTSASRQLCMYYKLAAVDVLARGYECQQAEHNSRPLFSCAHDWIPSSVQGGFGENKT